MRAQEQCSLYVSQKTYKRKALCHILKCGGGVGVCRKTAAANDFAAAVFLYKYMRMCKADTIQIKVSFYTYTTVKPVAGGGERKRFQ